ncbi:helix-turn-helix domain-containing protein [Phenylobacterium sp.]|uniref:helix-turn-helix domain-containing protein n=1 Tax=Phenylobacterium sp. TaxID=1871053 RepID=UPI0027378CC6|nr:helix-turn-helix domain-containing protein [Phenylobacterium sp.]MDP3869907.1 helix-turn-helix domain-containing protein [Phenylobacterium sp.]
MATSALKNLSITTICAIKTVQANGSPQQRTVLSHLMDRTDHGLSQVEAQHLYRVAALPRRIADLQDAGVPIRKDRREDPTGRAYVRYFLGA